MTMRAWKQANPEKVRAQKKRWRDRRKAQGRPVRRRSPRSREYDRELWQRHKDKRNAKRREQACGKPRCHPVNARARRWGAEGMITLDDIRSLYRTQHGQCALCAGELDGVYHVDHKIPLFEHGANTPDNVQLTCPDCNLRKGRTIRS